ncbi:hypothetical protein [Hyphomicrobium sp.]|uniref:hypothetical protein n=1 Tax=Hyphomicrobium sp. TaxID=82 RepID=UPI001DDB6C8D|nr:hypothetical protein [Hyphomicrobium sp.]MBY0559905.1 hypothetical protein [Hyphomicrobium sp.]
MTQKIETPWERYRREMREFKLIMGVFFAVSLSLMFTGLYLQGRFNKRCAVAGGIPAQLKSDLVCLKPDTIIKVAP